MTTLPIKLLLAFVSITSALFAAESLPGPSHGISYPAGWQEWKVIAVSHRTDNNTIRSIVGNEIAVKAAREGKTNPWPEGTVIGKVVWKDKELANWPAATVPGELVHSEFIFKDSKKYAKTHNWGWARWVGIEQKPFQEGAQVCIACHAPVEKQDWVYTEPARFPKIP